MTPTAFRLTLISTCLTLASCGSGSTPAPRLQDASANHPYSCVAQSPYLAWGEGLHQPSRQPVPTAAARSPVSSQPACTRNGQFRFGAARADITGPAGGKIHMGNESPDNYSAGIHIRQYARSFVIASPCNGKRIAMVLTDTGMMFESVRQAVLDHIAADPELAALYGPENVMLSATHTHSTPGGQAHYEAYNALRLGHDPQTFAVTTAGIIASFEQAHRNLEAESQTGPVLLAQGELLGANKSRAIPAYLANTAVERDRYRETGGGDITTNRLMTLLRLQRRDGKEVGSINWFAVHPTSDALSAYGLGAVPISGDNKGYAAYLFERFKTGTDDEPFVASFMQADEGDAFTQLWFDDAQRRAEQDVHLPANEPSPVTVANGLAQLDKALALYSGAETALQGPVDYRFGHVQMDRVEVNDPAVLATLEHPAELDSGIKRTCTASMGVSFPAAGHGAQPGEPGLFTPAGVTCRDPDYAQGVINDFMNLMGGNAPAWAYAYAVGCNLQHVPAGVDLGCQAEKPVLFVFGPPLNISANVVPFQLLRVGNLAIIGLPWEITTMAGRRIRDTVLDVLRDDGVDYAVITGLANDYVSYLTTREEYALQMYEAASNQFGPWSLAAVQQEIRRLALDMRDGKPTTSGPQPPRTTPRVLQALPPQGVDTAPPGSHFGAVLEDVAAAYAPGDTARAVFQASSPNSDLRTDDSFLFVERQQPDGSWEVIYRDADPETSFVWHSQSPQPQFNASPVSSAELLWRIPRNTPPGTYRLSFESTARTAIMQQDYRGESRAFSVNGATDICP